MSDVRRSPKPRVATGPEAGRSRIRWGIAEAMAFAGVRHAAQLHTALTRRGFALSLSQTQRLVAGEVTKPSLELLAAICDALHCEISRLLVRELPREVFPDISNVRPASEVRIERRRVDAPRKPPRRLHLP